jgi:hypothetical protein
VIEAWTLAAHERASIIASGAGVAARTIIAVIARALDSVSAVAALSANGTIIANGAVWARASFWAVASFRARRASIPHLTVIPHGAIITCRATGTRRAIGRFTTHCRLRGALIGTPATFRFDRAFGLGAESAVLRASASRF